MIASPAPIAHIGRGDLLDVILLALALGYAYAGYRRGLVAGAMSFGGFLVGACIGSLVGPEIARSVITHSGADALGQRLLALAVVVVLAGIGEAGGALAGARLRAALSFTPVRWADSAGGAVLHVAGLLVVAWLLAFTLAAAPFPAVAKQIERSAVLSGVNRVMPTAVGRLFAGLNRLLQRHEMPPLSNPFAGLPIPPAAIAPPDAGVVPPALREAGPSVVKITGVAPSCDREQEGSGFVFAREHVMTNAHVVAGVRDPRVALPSPGGRVLSARVVLFDPQRDVAVLYVPGLDRSPLDFTDKVSTGASAVVAGYPENGPLTAVPARVAGEQEFTGPDIYAERQVTREVYTLRARVRPGNSGGPLLSPSGEVDGVVFAAAVYQRDVGYALTASEVAGDARVGGSATARVSTRGCD